MYNISAATAFAEGRTYSYYPSPSLAAAREEFRLFVGDAYESLLDQIRDAYTTCTRSEQIVGLWSNLLVDYCAAEPNDLDCALVVQNYRRQLNALLASQNRKPAL